MKILHIVICSNYMRDLAYQEVVLPRYHALMGHEVTVLASCEIHVGWEQRFVPEEKTRMETGELLWRVGFQKIINQAVSVKLRLVPGLEKILEEISPEFIMLHGLSTISIPALARYMRKHPQVRLIADNHADFSNSAITWVSRELLNKGLWRWMAHILSPVTETFYGVLPARVDFLRNIYKLPAEKCRLLMLGAEDEIAEAAGMPDSVAKTRSRYGVADGEFLIVSGGKIDQTKRQTLLLMKAVRELSDLPVRLRIFGSVSEELREEFDRLADGDRIRYIGWLGSDDTYPVIGAADLVVYPGRHSTLWEQTAGQGIPMVCKYWDGTTHIDIGGNVRFLYRDDEEEICTALREIITGPGVYEQMKAVAAGEGKERFSYRRIAEKCLEKREI